MTNFPLFLALRYLRPKGSFVSVITVISIIGVVLGVAVLVIVTSVMGGFEQKIRSITLGFEPHVEAFFQPPLRALPMEGEEIEAPDPEPSQWRDLLEHLKTEPGVTKATPLIRDHAFMEFKGEPVAALLRAIRPQDYGPDSELAQMILDGELELRGESIVLGLGIAERLEVQVGDVITLYSSDNIREVVNSVRDINESETKEAEDNALSALEEVVLPVDVTVTGVFKRSLQFDQEVVVPLFLAQEILSLDGEVTSIGVWTEDSDAATASSEALAMNAPREWYFIAWMNRPAVRQWFETIRTERAMMSMVLMFIVIVAAFSIMNTMITVTVQKRREIGVITALGGRVGQVILIFLLQGAIVGAIGVILGFGAGLLVLGNINGIHDWIANLFGVELFPGGVYGVAEIPVAYDKITFAWITLGSFAICTVAALVPALLASLSDPAKALRNE